MCPGQPANLGSHTATFGKGSRQLVAYPSGAPDLVKERGLQYARHSLGRGGKEYA